MTVIINGTTGITTPGVTNTGTETVTTQVISPIVGAASGSTLSLQSNGTTNATLDTSGNLLVGTASVISLGGGYNNINSIGSSGGGLTCGTTSYQNAIWCNSAFGAVGTTQSIPLTFYTGNNEHARIDTSGNLLVGRTGQIVSGRLCVQPPVGNNTIETIQVGAGGYNYYSNAADNGGIYYHALFTEAGVQRGSITSNGSSTAYNTTSDTRLKNDQGVAQQSRINDVVIHDFTWKTDGSQDRGVFAQELAEVIPNAVTKGQTEDDYWQVDYSKLVPDLIVEVQSLRARVAQLEAKGA
jgi:hypothetical protein